MKRTLILAASLLMMAVAPSYAQNVQLHYDFGKLLYQKDPKSLATRPELTTTVEMFHPDDWGSTYFFVDMNYDKYLADTKQGGVLGAYWEISRELRFWKFPISIHAEYNGGLDFQPSGVIYNDAWLPGITYSFANKDFTKTFSISAMYKIIPRNASPHNFQFTFVWNLWFANKAVLLSGFIDFWREVRDWQGTKYIFLSEPQIWYNFNTIKGMEKVNLSIGSEVELSNNFLGKGFYAVPTLAVKWTFR
jgi:hypothetical protein